MSEQNQSNLDTMLIVKDTDSGKVIGTVDTADGEIPTSPNFNNSNQNGEDQSVVINDSNINNDNTINDNIDNNNNNNGEYNPEPTPTVIPDTSTLEVIYTSNVTSESPTSSTTPPVAEPSKTLNTSEKVESSSSINKSTAIGIGSGAALVLIALFVFIFLRKRKRNYSKEDIVRVKSEKSESEYQIGSEFLKTDNHLTLPFTTDSTQETSLSMSSEVISESSLYKENTTVLETNQVNDENQEVVLLKDKDVSIDVHSEINNKDKKKDNANVDAHTAPSKLLLSNKNKKSNSDINQYCIDMKFETPTLDITFPKPTLTPTSSLSSGWLNRNDSQPSLDNTNNKDTNAAQARYVTNNVITRPKQALITQEVNPFEDEIIDQTKQEQVKSKYEETVDVKKVEAESDNLLNVNQKRTSILSNVNSNSSLISNEKSSITDSILKHSPQVNLTPRKSILKKSSSLRAKSNPISRNTSVKKTTIGRSTSTLNRNNNSNSNNLSNDNYSAGSYSGMSNNLDQLVEDDELTSLPSLSRHNTVNSVATTASSMTNMRIPPVLSAFHHALPTPPTPKSTKFYGPDGELLSGQVINEELIVPDVLTDAIGGRDIYSNQDVRNIAGSYCTIRRNKNKNPRLPNKEDGNGRKLESSSLENRGSGHRRNNSQDYSHTSDKLEYYHAKPSPVKTGFVSPKDINKENYQPNIPSNLRDNFSTSLKTVRNTNLHYSKTLPRNFNSSRKVNDMDSGVYSRRISKNMYTLEEEKAKLKASITNEPSPGHTKRNSMEAEFLLQNANIPLTCFEEDLLKNSITEKDKNEDINSVISILKEEKALLNQIALETP